MTEDRSQPSRDGLRAGDVYVHFAGVKAVDGVSLHLDTGEILGLIGPNGAGKTTLVNVLSGFQKPTGGKVELREHDATGWSPERFARHGLTRTFQSVRLFGALSVFDNVLLGGLGIGLSQREARSQAAELLGRVDLTQRTFVDANSLPQGEERLLGIARSLAARPRLLLLDEPAAGLNEEESDALLAALIAIRADFGIGLLVVEHDMRLIMRLCDRVHVLNHGKTIAVGTPEEVQNDAAVIEAYLGSEAGHAAA